MKFLQPITDNETVNGIKEYLRNSCIRKYLLFCIRIYSGLRVSDKLSLQVGADRGKSHISIRESSTKKARKFIIHYS